MSSVQSYFAQIPNQSRLLYNVSGGIGFTRTNLLDKISQYKSQVLGFDGTILNTRDSKVFYGNLSAVTLATEGIYRDMGRKLYLQTSNVTTNIFTYCQLVQGPATEGVPDNYSTGGNVYICTWTNDTSGVNPIPVYVARTG